jgi:hypothetical protein
VDVSDMPQGRADYAVEGGDTEDVLERVPECSRRVALPDRSVPQRVNPAAGGG